MSLTATRRTGSKPSDEPLGPVLALSYAGGVLYSAGVDGRVLRLSADLVVERVLHDDARDPVTALASMGEQLVMASAKVLAIFDHEGAVVAKCALEAPTIAVIVRGDAIFVLGGGRLTRFERGAKGLKKVGAGHRHAAGTARELDVDDRGTHALIVLDGHRVELVDLVKRKRLAEWADKKAAISARFTDLSTTLFVVDDQSYECKRVKASTGRSTGRVLSLASSINGPMLLDASRAIAAIRSTGEDVDVVDLASAQARFFLQPEVSPASEIAAAAIGRMPRLVELAPGFVVRKGSEAAAPPPTTQSALALDDGGAHVAAGYLTGEIVVSDTRTARVVSSSRGTLASGRCRDTCFVDDGTRVAAADRDAWIVFDDGRVLVADLDEPCLREGPRLELPDDPGPATRSFHLDAHAATLVGRSCVARWDRRDPSRRIVHPLPPHVDANLIGGELVLIPNASVSHEGFDVATCDLESGVISVRARFVRDATRFPHGNDPAGWVRMWRAGDLARLTIWAGAGMSIGRDFAFDTARAALLAPLPMKYDACGSLGLRVAPELPAIVVFDLRTGQTTESIALLESDVATGPAARAASARVTVAALGAKVVVWRAERERLTLLGHREPSALWLGANGRGVLVRDRGSYRVWDLADDSR